MADDEHATPSPDERVELYCTECAGNYGSGATAAADDEYGYLGYRLLPPAGLQGRDAVETLRTALTWGHLELMAAAGGVCPRCSATLDREVETCPDPAARVPDRTRLRPRLA